jgi:hypothetical protein
MKEWAVLYPMNPKKGGGALSKNEESTRLLWCVLLFIQGEFSASQGCLGFLYPRYREAICVILQSFDQKQLTALF